MEAITDEWQSLSQEFARLTSQIERVSTVNVNAIELRKAIARVALQYLKQTRPILLEAYLNEHAAILDEAFTTLLHLSEGNNALSSYKKQIKRIRKAIPAITSGLALQAGKTRGSTEPNADEQRLIGVLSKMIPSAAISYRQAIADLQDGTRVSFRGPALEFREVLRETLDHMASDKDVMADPGFKLEKGRHGPTMKQKVRFILKARKSGSAALGVVEDSASTADSVVGDLTRSVYNLGSLSTHVSSERTQVLRLKRYVDAVLHDLLELS